jgi:sulfur-carrier protein
MILMTVTMRYFAWVRERIGHAEEQVDLPAGLVTVAELVAWQKTRGDTFAHAFERADIIRVAIDQIHVKSDAPLAGAREIAFFPPVTGG